MTPAKIVAQRAAKAEQERIIAILQQQAQASRQALIYSAFSIAINEIKKTS